MKQKNIYWMIIMILNILQIFIILITSLQFNIIKLKSLITLIVKHVILQMILHAFHAIILGKKKRKKKEILFLFLVEAVKLPIIMIVLPATLLVLIE